MTDKQSTLNNWAREHMFLFVVCAIVLAIAPQPLLDEFTPHSEVLATVQRLLGSVFPLFAIVLGPLAETLLLQALPHQLGERYLKSEAARLTLLILPFALGHVTAEAPLLGFINGVWGGVLLGLCYRAFASQSTLQAILLTTLIHAAHNAWTFYGP